MRDRFPRCPYFIVAAYWYCLETCQVEAEVTSLILSIINYLAHKWVTPLIFQDILAMIDMYVVWRENCCCLHTSHVGYKACQPQCQQDTFLINQEDVAQWRNSIITRSSPLYIRSEIRISNPICSSYFAILIPQRQEIRVRKFWRKKEDRRPQLIYTTYLHTIYLITRFRLAAGKNFKLVTRDASCTHKQT